MTYLVSTVSRMIPSRLPGRFLPGHLAILCEELPHLTEQIMRLVVLIILLQQELHMLAWRLGYNIQSTNQGMCYIGLRKQTVQSEAALCFKSTSQ